MKKLPKRLLAALLALALILGLLPGMALAAESAEAGQGAYQVTIYASVQALTLQNAAGENVPLTKGESGDYATFTFRGDAGTYTYRNDAAGTGMFKVTGDADVYLRLITYNVKDARTDYKMRIVNTEDTSLVCESLVTTDKQSATVLVPAYGYNVRYQYFCEPTDETYCGFYGNLWSLPGATEFAGFKAAGFNLSDGRAYNIGRKATVSFKIPAGATLKVEELVKFYRQNNQFKTTFVKTEGGYDYYTAEAPTNSGGDVYYVVSKEGYMKKAHTFTPKVGLSIEVDALEATPNLHESRYEASIITNGNASKFISLQQGEAFGSWSSRAWQAINDGLQNGHLEPDKHYYVLDGDSVTVDEYGIVKAVKPGLSIVALTYDAMEFDDQVYGAINDESVAVYAFMVNGNREGVTTGLEGLSDLNTFYYAKTVKVDGSDEVKTNDSIPKTIKPTAENGQSLTVSLMNVCGYPTPKASSWQTVAANADGSYTLNLKAGRNIVKVQAGDAMRCYVLGAVGSDVTVQNVTSPGQTICAGETVKVAYSNVTTPQPKLGAIYNPGYGNTTYLEGTLLDESGKELATVSGEGTQYGIKENAGLQVIPDAAGEFTVSNVRIHLGSYGSAPDTHLALSPQSEGGNYDGTDSPEATNYWCSFQDVSFSVIGSDYPERAAAIVERINAIGEVTLTDECKAKIDAARLAYDEAPVGVKNLITADQLKVLTDAEAAYETLLFAQIETAIEKRTVDGKEYYVLKTADELVWFAKLVNGLQSGGWDARQETANALLDADITFNENVLDADGNLTKQAGWRQWTPIGGYTWISGTGFGATSNTALYKGIFDGQGHTISGLVMTTAWSGDAGLFGSAPGATVKNVKVKDSYLSGGNVGGIVGSGSKATIENVSYQGQIRASTYAAGIIAYTSSATVRNASFTGTLVTKDSKTAYAGGIMGLGSGTVEDCAVDATLEAGCKVGGIVGGYNNLTVRRCSFRGSAVSSLESAAGIVGESSGNVTIEDCYSTGNLTAAGRAAGITQGDSEGNTVRNCYALGTLQAPETFGIASKAESLDGPSYCLDVNASTATGNTITKTATEFRDGTVAWLLGKAFGQKLGVDASPVLSDGTNRVFMAGGDLRNASAETCDLLINAIGTVALDGTENCFGNVTLAQDCYDMLAKAERAKVTKLETLTQKQADYTTAVNALIAQIDALGEITLASKDALEAARGSYDRYLAWGGDAARVTNYETLTAAEAAYAKCVQADNESKVEESIQIKTIDGEKYYAISNLEQLQWYIALLNGTLAAKERNTAANAILTADITVNKNLLATLLDETGAVKEDQLANMTRLPMIDKLDGTFDGDGHTISGALYCSSVASYEHDGDAMILNVNGTVKDLVLKDAYTQGFHVAGIAYYLNKDAKLLRCGFEGKLFGKYWAGGLTNTSNPGALIDSCYCIADIHLEDTADTTTQQAYRIGGISCHNYGKVQIKNTFVSGTIGPAYFQGAIASILNGSGTVIDNCYYPKVDGLECISDLSRDVATQIGGGKLQGEMMTSGELAYRLGDAFGQRIGVDAHPMFRTADNAVYYVNGAYANASAQVAIALIDAIGTVALDGAEHCFTNLATADACYRSLTEAERAQVTNVATLRAAQAAEQAVIDQLAAEIKAVTPMTLDKIELLPALTANLAAYTQRGGDTAKIPNYADYEQACKDAERLPVEEAEKTMKTEEIDGATYYIIENADQLNWFARLVNGTLPTGTAQNNAANAILKCDITINQDLLASLDDILLPSAASTEKLRAIAPIGYGNALNGAKYTGTFDGNGHTISGLYLPAGEVTSQFGLFGQLDGTVKNLHVRDSYVGGQATDRVGGIVGYGDTAVVENCSYEGVVIGASNVGGLIGYYNGVVRNCRTNITMATYNTAARQNAGGLVGNMGSKKDFINCYAQGTIYCNKGTAGATYCGGLTGTSAVGTIAKNCYAAVELVGASKNVGGLTGFMMANKWSNCYSYNTVKAVGASNAIGKDVAGKAESKTAEEFADGTVLALLGDAYVQRIGVDPYPVFAEALPTAAITVELERDNYAKHAEVIARVYLTGTQTAGTIGYSLTYNAAELELQTAQAAANLTADDRSAAGSILRTLALADGAKLEAGEDGRILLDTLTFTAKKACTASFGLDGIAGDETFGDSPAFVHDTGVSLATTLRQTYVTTEAADREAAAAVDALIDAIGKVTTDSGDAIAAARAAYDALTPQQKDYVEHYETLTFAEETYQRLPDCASGKHVYPEWKVTKEATCDETGEMSGICKYCGHVGTLTVAALGHDWDAGKQTKAPTCTEAGTMHFTCQRAGCKGEKDETIAKLAHEYEATVTAPTCESAGYTTHTCKTCGDSYIDTMVPAKGHTDKAVVTAPTCDTMGYTTHTCATCGRSYVDSYTAATDHDYKSEVTKEATCTAEGVLTFTCQHEGCGKTYTQAIPKADHAMTATVTKPTCLSFGYTEYRCQHCDYSYVNAFTQPTGHAWNDGEVTVQPTIWETGTMTYTCENCGETRTEEIAKLPACEGGVYCPSRQFADVDQTLWYHDAVDYVFTHGLMYGTTDTTFSPDDALTRAMFVTMLYRMEGKPEVKDAASFTDVPEGAYYADAVAWASANGVVYGTSETAFSPDAKITREQMAAMMRRYADYRKLTSSTWVDLGSYADASSISSWATESMQWAVASELMYGNTRNQLQPTANATRAQAAAILQRFATKIVK